MSGAGFAAKSGWGPGVSGDDYLVRQFGMVPAGSTRLGVALAAEAPKFESGVAVLDQLVEWFIHHLLDLTKMFSDSNLIWRSRTAL
ncbi:MULTISPECIES: hypothetical protein [Mycobacterium]|uniref:hypothetical protein n=1 Tax=Mycobacterium TaxID=1763 RepID=UPI001EF01331|nr:MULTISPECIES: hypothetical protein [Mycobacterium]